MPTELRLYQTDDRKKEEGIWKPIGIGDIEMLFRSPQSRTFQRIKERVERRYADKTRKNRMSQIDNVQMQVQYLAEGAILDWRNVLLDGETLPWSPEIGKQLLNPFNEEGGNEDLFLAVAKAFNDIDGYYRESYQDSEKNSLTLSAIN